MNVSQFDAAPPGILKIAIMAVGGQGGGVLTGWIVDLAEANGWQVQSTAVAGVAQRTGATIYYIEMAPDMGRSPVFALAPAPGDVDILIAAEWMEAGRAVVRGFVTPDRTTLIASTHRALAVSEKIVPGDGMASGEEIAAALDLAARDVIAFDMHSPAVAAGSAISSTLFGALAACGRLPFSREEFEATIRRSGRGVEQSLAAFGAGFAGEEERPAQRVAREAPGFAGPAKELAAWERLRGRVDALPSPAQVMALRGLVKVVDFQDLDYGAEYLERVAEFADLDTEPEARLTIAIAKHLANAMAYDDVIRVADLKTRPSRFARIRSEMGVTGQGLRVTEYMHPRIEEALASLPAGLARWIGARAGLKAWLDRRINHGRHVRTDRAWGYLALYLVAGVRRWRRRLLRHSEEMAHIDTWLGRARIAAGENYDLGVEILACRRLIKGYSDTHARGLGKFDRVLGALAILEDREDAAEWIRRLREAALQDENGAALDGALKTIASFAD